MHFIIWSNHCQRTYWKQSANFRITIGKHGSGDGEFNDPLGVVMCKTSGRKFVSDCWNFRIQVLSSDGKFLFKFGSKESENGQF